ncbi:methyltransferase, FkbM family domain protein [Lyngbya aestuarii BL J]|uniref:Methyltransferase, FkbM family domain protein n=1 Tax=Lyngbya aestuarii BL J TaxID=1348334 RepID=U7Q8U5_9CYAN|nr:FkbM family methyltransferase [Lyngbya aestuarii]ERT04249.1 methyltransferase, FkbM family domain protein [Lyngbya aestuarii BL J]
MSFPLWYIEKKLGHDLPKGIIHVGANEGQEFEAYQAANPDIVLWIEAIPTVYEKLCSRISADKSHYAVQHCCSDVNGDEVTFNIANLGGLASSMLPLGESIKQSYPGISYVNSFKILTRTLDSILEESFAGEQFDLLVMDTQGAELKVLQGAHQLLKRVRYVYAEVSEYPLYDGGCTYEQIDSLLKLYGFKLKNLAMNGKNWGDALYAK